MDLKIVIVLNFLKDNFNGKLVDDESPENFQVSSRLDKEFSLKTNTSVIEMNAENAARNLKGKTRRICHHQYQT